MILFSNMNQIIFYFEELIFNLKGQMFYFQRPKLRNEKERKRDFSITETRSSSARRVNRSSEEEQWRGRPPRTLKLFSSLSAPPMLPLLRILRLFLSLAFSLLLSLPFFHSIAQNPNPNRFSINSSDFCFFQIIDLYVIFAVLTAIIQVILSDLRLEMFAV